MSSSSPSDVDRLRAELECLKCENQELRQRLERSSHHDHSTHVLVSNRYSDSPDTPCLDSKCQENTFDMTGAHNPDDSSLVIIVLGASGDLAVKKTYPALFSLFRHGHIPKDVFIVGYARSPIKHEDFINKISAKFPKDVDNAIRTDFLNRNVYFQGQYSSADDFRRLVTEVIAPIETSADSTGKKKIHANRVFYMAIPPDAFLPSAASIHKEAMSRTGWTRMIVEKPFGRDLASSNALGSALSKLFPEESLFRIDHYLGKEMVQNLQVLRFANRVFEPIWNRDHIQCVVITFKEDFGTQGRGGYFDNFGIIRDVIQNHLMQMVALLAMEPPLSMQDSDVQDEKVRLLRAIKPIVMDDVVIGQYSADPKGREPGYLDDPGVPKDSVTPTFATTVLHINNPRWAGTPFILKAGKGLNEKKADIRIQFKTPVNTLFGDISPNELVLRVGPDEAVYLKMTAKQPGLEGGLRHTELDLSYKTRFKEEAKNIPEAYERLILDVVKGDHNLFVRDDELKAAWQIFTPILHQIETEKIKPEIYEFGGRGPASSDALIQRYGYVRTDKYSWSQN